MAAPGAGEPEPNSWDELLRKMLPEGAPLPDEEHLDYSISVDYKGPSPFYQRPIKHIHPKTKFTSFSKRALSLTPKNAAFWRSHSSSDSTDVYDRRLSVSSVAFDESEDESFEDRVENFGESCDRENPACSDDEKKGLERKDDGKKEMGRKDCVLRGGSRGRGCGRCGKRKNGLFVEMEECMVCGAEYCMKCVLKAMGVMSEGRKCVGCIGNPIDEAKRGKLGTCSRALARVCGQSEIKQIMLSERECKANQVRPEQVIVNGRPLNEEELTELLACRFPPKDLKPGRYWYDKESGLWGKEGEKPSSIICSRLDVGGKLQVDASKGNTRVYMNGREITRVELRILKVANVQCPRDTRFWLYEDGSYEEEGQNNIKGCIWRKASIRFLCSLFSLPVPSESLHCAKGQPASFSARLLSKNMEQSNVHNLFLLGLEGSGSETIFKLVKFIYTNKFTAGELLNMKLIIQSNIYRYLCILLEGREHFEEEALNKESSGLAADRSAPGESENDMSRECMYSVNQKIKQFSDGLLDIMAAGDIDTYFPTYAREHASFIDEIWKDPAIQETYKRREELQVLPDVAKYFLDRVVEVSSDEYEPSEKDILLAEGVTPSNGVACIEFSFDDHSAISEICDENSVTQNYLPKYQLIQLSSKGLQSSEKRLEMFEGMNAIVFCVSLTDYHQVSIQRTGIPHNKMLENRDFLEKIVRNSCFVDTPCILLLNKYDQFQDKIKEIPLTVCEWFRDFHPSKSRSKNHALAHQACYHVAVKFKRWHSSVTGRKLYVWPIRDLDRTSIDEAFRYIREIIDWEEKNGEFYALSTDSLSSAELSCSSRNF
ncbi:extra-large guanine nucleotide-binding protein 3-like [Primulina tabacum]|uniref:extra-large guanine nucleotide-binding protein 3-like n=1 Tax=Primulina tabacum TaxID=48773 RepID=UPI003F59FF04